MSQTDDHAAGLSAGDEAAIGHPDRQDGSPEFGEDVRLQPLSLSFLQTINADVGDEGRLKEAGDEAEINHPDTCDSSPGFIEDITTVPNRCGPVPDPGLQAEIKTLITASPLSSLLLAG